MAGFPQFPLPNVAPPRIGNPLADMVAAASKPIAGSGTGGMGGLGGLLRTMMMLQRMQYYNNRAQTGALGGTKEERKEIQQKMQFDAATQELLNNPEFKDRYARMWQMSSTGRLKELDNLRKEFIAPLTARPEYSQVDSLKLYNAMLGKDKAEFTKYAENIQSQAGLGTAWDAARMSGNRLWGAVRNIAPWTDSEQIARETEQANKAIEDASPYLRDQALRAAEGESFWGRTSGPGGWATAIGGAAPEIAGYLGAGALATLAAPASAGAAAAATLLTPANIAAAGATALLGGSQSSLDFIARVQNDPNLTEAQKQEAINSWSRRGVQAAGAVAGALPPTLRPLRNAAGQALTRAGVGTTGRAYRAAATDEARKQLLQQQAGRRAVEESRRGFFNRGAREAANTGLGMGLMSAGQQLGTNIAYNAATGENNPIGAGVWDAFVQGGLTGAVLGGAMGSIRRPPARPANLRDDGMPRPTVGEYALEHRQNPQADPADFLRRFAADYNRQNEPQAIEDLIKEAGVSKTVADEWRALYNTSGRRSTPQDVTPQNITGDNTPPVNADALRQAQETPAEPQPATPEIQQPAAPAEEVQNTSRPTTQPAEPVVPAAAGAAPTAPRPAPTVATNALQSLVDTISKAAGGKRLGPVLRDTRKLVDRITKTLDSKGVREELSDPAAMRGWLGQLQQRLAEMNLPEDAQAVVRDAQSYHALLAENPDLATLSADLRKAVMDNPSDANVRTNAIVEAMNKAAAKAASSDAAVQEANLMGMLRMLEHPLSEVNAAEAAALRDNIITAYEQTHPGTTLRAAYGEANAGTQSIRGNVAEGAGGTAGADTSANSGLAAAAGESGTVAAAGNNGAPAAAGSAAAGRRSRRSTPQNVRPNEANATAAAQQGANPPAGVNGRTGQSTAGGRPPVEGAGKLTDTQLRELGDDQSAARTGSEQQPAARRVNNDGDDVPEVPPTGTVGEPENPVLNANAMRNGPEAARYMDSLDPDTLAAALQLKPNMLDTRNPEAVRQYIVDGMYGLMARAAEQRALPRDMLRSEQIMKAVEAAGVDARKLFPSAAWRAIREDAANAFGTENPSPVQMKEQFAAELFPEDPSRISRNPNKMVC